MVSVFIGIDQRHKEPMNLTDDFTGTIIFIRKCDPPLRIVYRQHSAASKYHIYVILALKSSGIKCFLTFET